MEESSSTTERHPIQFTLKTGATRSFPRSALRKLQVEGEFVRLLFDSHLVTMVGKKLNLVRETLEKGTNSSFHEISEVEALLVPAEFPAITRISIRSFQAQHRSGSAK